MWEMDSCRVDASWFGSGASRGREQVFTREKPDALGRYTLLNWAKLDIELSPAGNPGRYDSSIAAIRHTAHTALHTALVTRAVLL